jgi:hypothetical protein
VNGVSNKTGKRNEALKIAKMGVVSVVRYKNNSFRRYIPPGADGEPGRGRASPNQRAPGGDRGIGRKYAKQQARWIARK